MPICDPMDPMYNFFKKDTHDNEMNSLNIMPFLLHYRSVHDVFDVGYTLFKHNEKVTYLRLWEYWGWCNYIDTRDFAHYWFNVFI